MCIVSFFIITKTFADMAGLILLSLMLLNIQQMAAMRGGFSPSEKTNVLEAAIMDLEFSNVLLPSVSRTKLIQKQLSAIRNRFPKMENIHAGGKWQIGELIVSAFKNPIRDCVKLINASQYGPVKSTNISAEVRLFKFQRLYNPEKLAPIISEMCNSSAEPNNIFGGANKISIDILSEAESRYIFSKGSGDCMAGCIFHHHWQFSVTPRGVKLEKEWGNGDLNSGDVS